MKPRYPVARHLQQLTEANAAPFALPLLDRTGPLSCDRLLQLQPGQTAAFHGYYFNAEVLARLYFRTRQHAAEAQQEIDGLRALQNAGCATPAFLYAGLSSDQAASVVLLKWLPGARCVAELWRELSPEDPARPRLLHGLAACLARQHMAGLRLTRPQLSHYLWHEERIVCITGGQLRIQREPLAAEASLTALAELFVACAPRWDALLAEALAHYLQQRFGSVADTGSQQKFFWQHLARLRRATVQQLLNGSGELALDLKPASAAPSETNTATETPATENPVARTLQLSSRKYFWQTHSPLQQALQWQALNRRVEIAGLWPKNLQAHSDGTVAVHTGETALTLDALSEAEWHSLAALIAQYSALSLSVPDLAADSFSKSAPLDQLQLRFAHSLLLRNSPEAARKQWQRAGKKLQRQGKISEATLQRFNEHLAVR